MTAHMIAVTKPVYMLTMGVHNMSNPTRTNGPCNSCGHLIWFSVTAAEWKCMCITPNPANTFASKAEKRRYRANMKRVDKVFDVAVGTTEGAMRKQHAKVSSSVTDDDLAIILKLIKQDIDKRVLNPK